MYATADVDQRSLRLAEDIARVDSCYLFLEAKITLKYTGDVRSSTEH